MCIIERKSKVVRVISFLSPKQTTRNNHWIIFLEVGLYCIYLTNSVKIKLKPLPSNQSDIFVLPFATVYRCMCNVSSLTEDLCPYLHYSI